MVIKFFFKYSKLSNSGMAVISLLLASVFTCPSTTPFSFENALTIWIAPFLFPLSKEPLMVFPSIAIISPSVISWHSCIHSINIFSKAKLSMLLTTRAMVSSTGMPLSKSPYFFSHSSLSCPKSSISCHSSAPAITAHTVRNKIADNLCLTFPCCRISGVTEI